MTTRATMIAKLDELRAANFAAYAQVTSGNCLPSYAMDDATADWWQSDDAANILADIVETLDAAKDGAR